MKRGEVWWADLPPPVGRWPVLLQTQITTLNAAKVHLVENAVKFALNLS